MFTPVEKAINVIREGGIIIVVDDENRENEGDFVMAAEKATPHTINYMALHGRGLICCPLTRERAAALKLPLMVDDNDCPYKTNFTVSVDAAGVTSTGISASDRAITCNRLADDSFGEDAFLRPGHMFPLIARDGGVVERPGHTEAAVDLARLAGLKPAGIICEIMNPDGSMSRLPELMEYAKKNDMPLISIEQLVDYRQQNNT